MVLFLKIKDVETNLKFFRCLNFDSKMSRDEDSNEVHDDKLKVSDAKTFPSTLDLDLSTLNENWNLWRKGIDASLNPNFSLDEEENETGTEVDGQKESNKDNILMN